MQTTNKLDLTNTTLVGIRQYDVTELSVVELAFTFAKITWVEPNDASAGTYTDSPATFAPPTLITDACDIIPATDRAAGRLDLDGGTQLKGSETAKGHEDQVQVYQTCHTLETFGSNPQHFAFTIIKRSDAASLTLRSAMVNGTRFASLKLLDSRTNPQGQLQEVFTTTLTNAQVADIEIVPSVDTGIDYYERVSFTYQKITWTATQGGITASDNWR